MENGTKKVATGQKKNAGRQYLFFIAFSLTILSVWIVMDNRAKERSLELGGTLVLDSRSYEVQIGSAIKGIESAFLDGPRYKYFSHWRFFVQDGDSEGDFIEHNALTCDFGVGRAIIIKDIAKEDHVVTVALGDSHVSLDETLNASLNGHPLCPDDMLVSMPINDFVFLRKREASHARWKAKEDKEARKYQEMIDRAAANL